MSRKRRRRKRGRSSQHDPDEAAEEESQEQPAETEDRRSSEGAEESTAGSEVEDPERQDETSSEGQSAELGIVVPETRQGEVDPVKIAEALHEMSKVNLDYQRRRLAEGRGIEEFQNDTEIVASIRREEEALGMLDPVTGQRREPHALETPQSFGMIWWGKAFENLPVSYLEAVAMAREARAAAEGVAVGGTAEGAEDPLDDAGDPESEEEEPSDGAAGSGVGDSAVSEAVVAGDAHVGRERGAVGARREPEDGATRGEDETGTVAKAVSETGAGARAGETKAGGGAGVAQASSEAGAYEAAIAEVRGAVEGLAAGMNETVRSEIAMRMDGLAEGNRESSNMMLRALVEGVKGLEALIPVFEKGEVAGLAGSVGGLKESVAELSAKLPAVREGDVPALIAVLKEFSEKLNAHVSDFNWAREMEKEGGRWRHWVGAVVTVPMLVAVGLFGQQQFDIVPDGTNGWKTLVWETHGIEVATCMRRASQSRSLVHCPLRVRPR
ncbi:MAG: hypothetical protein OYH76_24755 [Defluviicoccus sp.]|nr:hypothetical protein [Defluviicoccus sp.]MDE0279119.1 hypothetical protein [Defluviicoccus sp.]